MKKQILVLVAMLAGVALNAQSFQILQHSDTIFMNQPIQLILQSHVLLQPTCGTIHSLNDSISQSNTNIDLTFDITGPNVGSCSRLDTVYTYNYILGTNTVAAHLSFFDNSIPPGTYYNRLSSDSVTVVVLNATGISENSGNQELKLNPNPAFNYFKLSSGNHLQNVEVYSLSGQLVKSYSKQNRYDVSDLPNGIYVVRAIGEETEFHQKLVVAR